VSAFFQVVGVWTTVSFALLLVWLAVVVLARRAAR
jgi:hypothetical protein